MTAIELDRVEERTEEKKEVWKNRYLCTDVCDYRCDICGYRWTSKPGDEWLGGHCHTYPSKSQAEAGAAPSENGLRYLGPIRIEAAP